jgi:spore coat protein SA
VLACSLAFDKAFLISHTWNLQVPQRNSEAMIYHVLPEAEPFSEQFGGALSRWAANVLRGDDNSTVICPWADATWGFPRQRVWKLPGLQNYRWWARILRSQLGIMPGLITPAALRLKLLRFVFSPLLKRMRRGDTVYIHNRPEFALALSPACRRAGAHVVLHLQNSHLPLIQEPYHSLLDVDALVFCSDFLRAEAGRYLSRVETAVVIPNGADEQCFFPAALTARKKTTDPIVLFVGRLVPEKGVQCFVDAMRLLLERRSGALGRIIGSTYFGSNRSSEYVKKIKRELPSNVHFANYISGETLAEEFRRAAIFCCPSVWNEPFGMVNVEAMATRLPVVATAVGGIPEIFEQGGGILVPPGSAAELADAIESLARDPAKREALGAQGYQIFKTRFRWETIRAQYLDLVHTEPQSNEAGQRTGTLVR